MNKRSLLCMNKINIGSGLDLQVYFIVVLLTHNTVYLRAYYRQSTIGHQEYHRILWTLASMGEASLLGTSLYHWTNRRQRFISVWTDHSSRKIGRAHV